MGDRVTAADPAAVERHHRRAAAGCAPYDPDCYLCPGNERVGGIRNPNYDATFVFANDFAALLPDAPVPSDRDDGWLHRRSSGG